MKRISIPGFGVITAEEELTDEEFRKLKERWSANYEGTEMRGFIALPPGVVQESLPPPVHSTCRCSACCVADSPKRKSSSTKPKRRIILE